MFEPTRILSLWETIAKINMSELSLKVNLWPRRKVNKCTITNNGTLNFNQHRKVRVPLIELRLVYIFFFNKNVGKVVYAKDVQIIDL